MWSENNIAAFGHRYVTDTIPCYAIFQINTGETAVNSKTGYPLTLRIGNDTKIHIKSDGNVGIGIDNPDVRLQVNSTSNCYLKISGPHASQKAISFYDTTNSIQRYLGCWS